MVCLSSNNETLWLAAEVLRVVVAVVMMVVGFSVVAMVVVGVVALVVVSPTDIRPVVANRIRHEGSIVPMEHR